MKSYTDINKKEINGTTVVQCWGLDFFDVDFPTSFISKVAKLLDSGNEMEKQLIHSFEWEKIYQLAGNIFLIEYGMKSLMEAERALLKERYKKVSFFPNEEEDGSQYPEAEFHTEYNGKYYQCVRANLLLKDWFDVDEKWIHQWVIFSPLKYLNFTENNTDETRQAVDNILTNKKDS